MSELVTRAVIAQRFGVSRAAVMHWTKYDDFPPPDIGVYGVQVYDWNDVVRWRIERRQRWVPRVNLGGNDE